MMLKVYGVYDEELEDYGSVQVFQNDVYLRRYYENVVANAPFMKKHKDKFAIYQIGNFDSSSGAFTNMEHRLVCKVADFIEEEN